ncbi:uncharacterized protein UV8b_01195 [Ustilaginoidea virens]|uniref:Increased sodium tolerance protein 1 n=1 Tax=Ustilaginoidea virens TaxID=1159556 RepID=A0A8E5HK45_USTVR|nr:uncharacterized protein UV8b_01195 [Ustilaginoidea virens]QUC16954.1 hypothetical protein UV8b_01195 [Ustilaginoidea virens]
MPPATSILTRLKVQLKLAIARLRMVQKRDEQLAKVQQRAMAQLLEAGKIDSATIRVENIIRSDITTELHEMLELYCELLIARAGLMEGPVCDPGLEEAVKSIIYAAPKTEIKELGTVRQLLGEKYGKEFVMAAMENAGGKVNERVVRKLSVEPPKPELVQGYLEEIARAYGVAWPRRGTTTTPPPRELMGGSDEEEDDDDEDEHGPRSGGSAEQKVLAEPRTREKRLAKGDEELDRATPPRGLAGPKSPVTVTPPRRTTENIHPKVTLGSVELKPDGKMAQAAGRAEPDGAVPDISDLERRFAALKKR